MLIVLVDDNFSGKTPLVNMVGYYYACKKKKNVCTRIANMFLHKFKYANKALPN